MTALEVFEAALSELDPQLEQLLAETSRYDADELVERICESWQLLAEQLAEIDMPALTDVMVLYAENLDLFWASRADGCSEHEQQLLRRWQHACRDYLRSPGDVNVVTRWVELLASPLWPNPLSAEEVIDLVQGLTEVAARGAIQDVEINAPLTETSVEANACAFDDEPVIEPLAEREQEPVDPLLVQMIAGEFAKVADDLTHSLAKINCASLAEYQRSLSANDFMLENINKACETVGLFGLSYVFRRLWLNAVAKVSEDHNYDEECNLFGIALLLIGEYLSDIGNDKHCTDMVRHLCEPGWRKPLPETMQARLFAALNVTVADPENQHESLERIIAKAEDVVLSIADDVDVELVQTLVHELPHLTEGFSGAIQELVGETPKPSQLLEAQRIAHTLKGAGNTIGIQGIANLTHSLESILEALTTEQKLPGMALGNVLLDAADCLSAMADCLVDHCQAPEHALSVLQNVLDWDYRIKTEGVGVAAKSADIETTGPDPAIGSAVSDQGQDDRASQPMTTIPAAILDQIIHVTADANSFSDRVQDNVSELVRDSKEVRDTTWRLSELVAEMDRLVNIQNSTVRDHRNHQGFDSLELDHYSELHTCLSRLAEVVADVREQNGHMHRRLLDSKNLLIEQHGLQKEQLEQVQSLRLAPVARIVPRCQRIVRQTARMTGKEVVLHIEGESALIDSEILNGLSGALLHLLRNAVDHGIEEPEDRGGKNKPRQGVINLSFTSERNLLTITCQDDGNGLDTEKIWSIAQSKGWVNNRQMMSDDQIHQLIFRPGFSTKSQASHVSGRGIGMDAIQSQVAQINGTMDLASSPGQGLTVTVTVPLNLYDAPMILVKINGRYFAISEHGVQRIFCALDGRCVIGEDGALRYQIEQRDYPAGMLSNLIGLERTSQVPEGAVGILFKAKNGDEQVVLVDQIIGYKSLMIRPLGKYLKGVLGVLGCVMLEDGQVAPAVDLFELISESERRNYSEEHIKPRQLRQQLANPLALVVDDSLSARMSAVQLLQDAGFEVQTAIDGLDAIEKIESRKPAVILSDLEMPRMNGIELTRYLKASTDCESIPIIMITSRSSEKHRIQADRAGVALYVVKPFNEDDLIVKLNRLLRRPLADTA